MKKYLFYIYIDIKNILKIFVDSILHEIKKRSSLFAESERVKREALMNPLFTKSSCLEKLEGKYGFPSILKDQSFNRAEQTRSSKIYISYRLPVEGSWFNKPIHDSEKTNPFTGKPEIVALWDHKTKRPIADRFLTPKQIEDKESSFVSAPLAKCSDPELEKFLMAEQLVTTEGGHKGICLKACKFIEGSRVNFKEPQLFSHVDRYLRRSIAVQGSMNQIVNDLCEHLKFLTLRWDEHVNMEGNASAITLKEDFASSYEKILDHLRDWRAGLELIKIGQTTILDWSMASTVACRSAARKAVLDRCHGTEDSKAISEALGDTHYAVPSIFGPMPETLDCKLTWEGNKACRLKVYVNESDIPRNKAVASGSGIAKRKAQTTFAGSIGKKFRGSFSQRVWQKNRNFYKDSKDWKQTPKNKGSKNYRGRGRGRGN